MGAVQDARMLDKDALTIEVINHFYSNRGVCVICNAGKIIDFVEEEQQ